MRIRSLLRPLAGVLPALLVVGALAVIPSAPAAAIVPSAAAAASPTYTNPVTDSFSDTYADPSIIRSRDGWYYLYATSDPLVSGGTTARMHISRSRDLTHWDYVGPVFTASTAPAWAAPDAGLWAPDIRRVGGRYVLYFTVTDTAAKPGGDYAIGAATAPTPTGPWTASSAPVVDSTLLPGSDPAALEYSGTIDPALLATPDGRLHLYYGGFSGGVKVVELDPTGLQSRGAATQITSPDRFEGAYVVRYGGWYYLMVSSAGCCAGPTTGYSVFAGRSQSPTGPFVDKQGVRLDQSRSGGTQVLVQNGNRWVGVGHNAMIQDTSGVDWIVYHAIDRDHPWLNEPGGINRRPTLIDRVDWVDGWPVVNRGTGPSDGAVAAPVVGSDLGIESASPPSTPALRAVAGTWLTASDSRSDAGDVGALRPRRGTGLAVATAASRVSGPGRVEFDVRFADPHAGTVCASVIGSASVAACVDARSRTLRIVSGLRAASAPIPARIDLGSFTGLVVEAAGGMVSTTLTESRLSDPVAEASVPGTPPTGTLSLTSIGRGADIDNLSVRAIDRPAVTLPADPQPADVLVDERFDGPLGDAWTVVRPRADVTTASGALVWPLGDDDLAGPGGRGPVVLRDVPDGDWIAETTLTLDTGSGDVRNFQQAGLVVYADDDRFVRVGSVAIGTSRVVESLQEAPGAADRVDRGSWIGGPTAVTMRLRIARTTAADGEQRYRVGSSVDGVLWRWGAVWTMPAGTDVEVGLYAGGGATPAATARFEEFRLTRLG